MATRERRKIGARRRGTYNRGISLLQLSGLNLYILLFLAFGVFNDYSSLSVFCHVSVKKNQLLVINKIIPQTQRENSNYMS